MVLWGFLEGRGFGEEGTGMVQRLLHYSAILPKFPFYLLSAKLYGHL